MKYKMKPLYPTIVDAAWWTGNIEDIPRIAALRHDVRPRIDAHRDGTITIHTPARTVVVQPRDWVIRNSADEWHACKPDIFEMTYEVAE